jgi:protein-S-isoprenylcysteine O-methyltransferase Ste14
LIKTGDSRRLILRASIAGAVTIVVFAGLLFAAAGRVDRPAGWAFIILFFALSQAAMLRLGRHDPALLEERLKPPLQRGQPPWDKILMASLALLWLGWLVLLGLDARFRWSAVPGWLRAVGAAGLILGYLFIIRVLEENTFSAPVVKIQRQRSHHVVATGPYAVVRHPMYARMCIMVPSIALLLGSWLGLAGALIIIAGGAVRAVKEERELENGLDGYRQYMAQVRYRLLPFIW